MDPHRLEAELALGYIDNLGDLALHAIESGANGPNITRLAAVDDCPSAYEKEIVLPRAMLEMGLTAIPIPQAAIRMAIYRTRDIVENRRDPLRYTRELERLWIASDYSDELQSLGTLDDELWLGRSMGETEERIRDRMFENMMQFLVSNPKIGE
jgi:hypothetical protein